LSEPLTIALDAMGGDNAPEIVLQGADIARLRFPGVRFAIYGDEAKINPLLERMGKLREIVTVHHTDEVVTNEIKPSVALRQGRKSSMQLAINAVRSGAAEGVVSAGNTGALMAMAKISLKTLPGIDRPAIAAIFPTQRSECVMLDLGANVECDSANLFQFGVMGSVFARTVLGLLKPSVGILNVGTEEMKGNDAVRQAAAYLRESKLPIQYHGFVEGDGIAKGTVDVIVTDGFTGNVALKTCEGTIGLYSDFLRKAFTSTLVSRLGYLLARHSLNKLRARVDPRRYNGAMFLGLNGIVIKSHGGTDGFGFANAIGVAVDMSTNGFNDKIIKELALHDPADASTARAAAS
jgi:glycerol-3-phosphate acyltransferase PlsX